MDLCVLNFDFDIKLPFKTTEKSQLAWKPR